MKKIYFYILALFILFFKFNFFGPYNQFILRAQAQETIIEQPNENLEIILFYGEGCPHCKAADEFLTKTVNSYQNLTFTELEIYYNQENNLKMQEFAKKFNTEVAGVPFIVVGEEYFIGYSELGSNQRIVESIEKQISELNIDNKIIENKNINNIKNSEAQNKDQGETFNLPIFGTIKSKEVSLPILTIIVAAIDGFNPCAMWTLLFLISLLIGIEDKKRRWILGTMFILTSGFVYFLFLSAWFNFFSFFGFVSWIKIGIGILALASGSYYLKDALTNKDNVCKVTSNNRRAKILNKLKEFTQQQKLVFAVIGIVALAFAVNLIELVCSAGLPAIYTQVLSMSDLPSWQYYGYLLLYILIFMLDDLFVFFTAMITLKAIGVESKYARISHFVGGFLLLVIGILLIFKPELLMFG